MNWKDWVLHNLWWKLTALGLATAVWFTFKQPGQGIELRGGLVTVTHTSRFPSIPVRILKSSDDLREFRVTPERVEVQVSGDRALLNKITAHELYAFVDVTGLGEGVTTNSVQLHAPAGVQLDRAKPEIVHLEEIDPGEDLSRSSPGGLVHASSFIEFPKIPVLIIQNPEDSRSFRVEPKEVDVRVSGDVALLERLSPTEIQAFVDVTKLEKDSGTNRVVMRAPAGLTLEKATPTAVRVERIVPANPNP